MVQSIVASGVETSNFPVSSFRTPMASAADLRSRRARKASSCYALQCLIHLEKHGNKLLITSVIDNLLKGASGTAVHNMNLLFGLAETGGLQLKPSAF